MAVQSERTSVDNVVPKTFKAFVVSCVLHLIICLPFLSLSQFVHHHHNNVKEMFPTNAFQLTWLLFSFSQSLSFFGRCFNTIARQKLWHDSLTNWCSVAVAVVVGDDDDDGVEHLFGIPRPSMSFCTQFLRSSYRIIVSSPFLASLIFPIPPSSSSSTPKDQSHYHLVARMATMECIVSLPCHRPSSSWSRSNSLCLYMFRLIPG